MNITLTAIAAVAIVITVSWLIRCAMTAPVVPVEKPIEHIEPANLMDEPLKPSHEVGRQIVRKIWQRRNERN